MNKPCAYGSYDCGKNNMGPCIHHQRDALEAALEAMTKERDAACDAANEFLDNNRQLRANWTAEVQRRIKALEMANALYNAFVAHESDGAISHKIADLIDFLECSEQPKGGNG